MRSHASLGVALIAALATMIAAGCGTSPAAPASPTGAPPLPLSTRSPATTAHIGGGCGFIPVHGAGSFGTMSTQRAATAASTNPQLSVFTSAIRTAALDRELNKMRPVTLFIPVNSAFAALSKTQVEFLRNPVNLVKVVRRQVVPHPVTPAQIARGGSVITLSGSRLALAKQGQTYRVNQATVLCGNIKTANGTLYVIDRVLLPPK
jgi:hypothetical protein